MIKAVIFDMDGVIIDSEPFYYVVEMELFKQVGISVSNQELATYVGATTRNMWIQLKKKFDIEQSVNELVNFERQLLKNILMSQKDLTPISGVVELIKDLFGKGIKLAIASSSSVDEIETVVDLFNIRDYFEQLVSADEVKNGKPQPDIFLLAAERLNVKPEECIVIEDSRNGVEAAKKAGIKCIGYKNLRSGSQDLSQADLVISTFGDTGTDPLSMFLTQFNIT